MPSKRTPLWTARVHFMTGRRWEGPFSAVVDATTPSAAAARAVAKAKTRLRHGARIRELTITLERQPPMPSE